MKNIKKTFITLSTIFALFTLSSCYTPSPLYGTWNDNLGNKITFISDGTFVVKGRVRPAGCQDESIRHTRWGRPDNRYFITSEWCTGWQGTFRHLILETLNDLDILR